MDEDYVTNSAWLSTPSRPDTIDEIADQFERALPGAEAFWTQLQTRRAARQHGIAPARSTRRAAS